MRTGAFKSGFFEGLKMAAERGNLLKAPDVCVERIGLCSCAGWVDSLKTASP